MKQTSPLSERLQVSRIFISYARVDVEFARRLARSLSELGANVWLDVKDIPAGMKWSTAIQEGLNLCEVMLVILTPEAMSSTNVEDEWQYFLDEKKIIIPILLKPAQVHFQLRRIQYIDFHSQDYEGALIQLRNELERKGVTLAADQQGSNAVSANATSVDGPPIPTFLPPPFDWCEISAGKVTLEHARERGGTEGGTFRVERFFMAQHPITNAQYQVFVDDGYSERRWWRYSPDAHAWREAHPEPINTPYLNRDVPRTYVTWFEAVAFCLWLQHHLTPKLTSYLMGGNRAHSIVLPTEHEWQRAAQGDDTRLYPWGYQFEAGRCNTRESGIRDLTPVTQFPSGASPFGVMDMSGNAWEWCLTEWGTDTAKAVGNGPRSVRGGSWFANKDRACVMFRDGWLPTLNDRRLGFRVGYLAPLR